MPLDQNAIVNVFKRIHLFQSLEDTKLEAAATYMEEVQLAKDETIFREGDTPDYFYIVARGKVKLTCQPNSRQPDGQLGFLEEDDYFGEEVLEVNWPRQLTATADEDVDLLRISRDNFIHMLQAIDSRTFEKALQMILDSYRLKLRKNFAWLEEGESIIFISRRHLIVLLRLLLKPVIGGLVILLMFLALFAAIPGWFTMTGLAVAGAGILGWLTYAYVDWTNDYYVVTTQRILFQERVILVYESRQESPLSAIQSSTVYTSQWGRWLNYGNVAVRTLIGTILFSDIINPNQIQSLIQQSQLRAQYGQRRLNVKEIKSYLTERIQKGPERPILPRAKPPAPPPDPVREFLSTMFHLRYEKGKTIIYRTNFFILLEKIFVPLMLAVVLIVLFALSASSRFAFLSFGTTCGVLFIFGIIVFGWLGYRYWDWHNDIYMITGDQIVDVNKKPLGREERQAALIKNIQSIEYKRLGIVGLLFNFGTVYIRVGDRQLTFDDVLRPSDVQRELFHAFVRVSNEEKKKQAEQDKLKTGDWFDAYQQWGKEQESPRIPPPAPRRGF